MNLNEQQLKGQGQQKDKEEDLIPLGYLRVTDILSRYSKLDYVDAHILEEACERGTQVHSLCEEYSKNLVMPFVEENLKGYFESFKNWFDNYVEKVVLTEKRINDDYYKVSGKFDFVLKFKGEKFLSLVDLKTSSSISKTWALQTAAYVDMITRNLGIQIEKRGCLMLSKEGKPARFVQYSDLVRDINLFESCLVTHRYFE